MHFRRSPERYLVHLISLLCCLLVNPGLVRADISDIKLVRGEHSNQIEIRVSAPLQVQRLLPGTSEERLVLELRSLDDSSFENWSSNRIDVDDEDHDLSAVLLEGSDSGGITMTITFRDGIHYEVLPQYSNYHILLTTAPTETYMGMAKASVTEVHNAGFAITLESRRETLPAPGDIPKTLAADHVVYTLPVENEAGPWQQLKVGFWPDKVAAESALKSLRKVHPAAAVSQVSAQEVVFGTSFALNPQIALKRVDLAKPDFVEPKSVSTRIAAVTPSNIDSGVHKERAFDWDQRTPASTGRISQASPAESETPAPETSSGRPLNWQSSPQPGTSGVPAGGASSAAAASPTLPNTPPLSEAAASELDELISSGDRAMQKLNYPLAISLYTRAAQTASGVQSEEAFEKLGVARELNGQIAQANKVYMDFLARYPDSAASARVRQRLATLRAIDAKQPLALRQPDSRDDSGWTHFTSISQFYRRQMLEISNDRSVPIDGIFSDMTLSAQKSGKYFEHDARISMSHLQDFTGTLGGRDFQISRAYWGSYLTDWSTGLRVGRQTKYDAGVVGRFDGAVLSHDFNEQMELGVAAGYLVDSSFDMPDTDRPFFGAYGNYTSAKGNFGFGPFIVQQNFEGLTDRRAIGVQAQYIGTSTFLRTLVDYDIFHSALNNVLFAANLGMGKPTSFSLSVEQSRSPYLTTRNALIGQPFETLGDLEQELVDLSLRELANDRTSVNRSVQLGVNHKFNERWEASADVLGMDTSSTQSSMNVPGFESRQDVSYSAQIRALDLLGTGTYSGLLIRRLEGEDSSTTSFYLNNRLRLGSSFWFYPRVRIDLREFDMGGQQQTSIIPSFAMDYQFDRRFRFEFEVGYEHTTREMIQDDINITGLFVRAGYRALF